MSEKRMTDAERIEALEAKCALLSASLKKADARVEELAALRKALDECEQTARDYESRAGVYVNGRASAPGAEHIAKGIRAAVNHVRERMGLEKAGVTP